MSDSLMGNGEKAPRWALQTAAFHLALRFKVYLK